LSTKESWKEPQKFVTVTIFTAVSPEIQIICEKAPFTQPIADLLAGRLEAFSRSLPGKP